MDKKDLPPELRKLMEELTKGKGGIGIINMANLDSASLTDCEKAHIIILMTLISNPGDDKLIHSLLKIGKRLTFLHLVKRSSRDN